MGDNIGHALVMLGVIILFIYSPYDPYLWLIYLIIGLMAFLTWVSPTGADERKEKVRLESRKLEMEIKILE